MQLNVASTGLLPSHSSMTVPPSMLIFIVARCGPRVPAKHVDDRHGLR
jgi:hypothetical protein